LSGVESYREDAFDMADKPPDVIAIDVFDRIGVNIEPGTGRLTVDGQPITVALTEAQRSLMEKVLKKVLAALPGLPYMIEVGIEVTPDGTWRAVLRLRQP